MLVTRKEDVKDPLQAPLGEEIFELIGTPDAQGGSVRHSLAYVIIPPGKRSPRHYHAVAEESYYMLKGRARMVIEGQEVSLTPGHAVLIRPREVHQIFNDSDAGVEFVVACAPAWQPGDFFEVGD